MLANGLVERGMKGVVYLDERDRKLVLMAATGRTVKEEECGIPKNERFVFYDQVHTTGTDVKHVSNALVSLYQPTTV